MKYAPGNIAVRAPSPSPPLTFLFAQHRTVKRRWFSIVFLGDVNFPLMLYERDVLGKIKETRDAMHTENIESEFRKSYKLGHRAIYFPSYSRCFSMNSSVRETEKKRQMYGEPSTRSCTLYDSPSRGARRVISRARFFSPPAKKNEREREGEVKEGKIQTIRRIIVGEAQSTI